MVPQDRIPSAFNFFQAMQEERKNPIGLRRSSSDSPGNGSECVSDRDIDSEGHVYPLLGRNSVPGFRDVHIL